MCFFILRKYIDTFNRTILFISVQSITNKGHFIEYFSKTIIHYSKYMNCMRLSSFPISSILKFPRNFKIFFYQITYDVIDNFMKKLKFFIYYEAIVIMGNQYSNSCFSKNIYHHIQIIDIFFTDHFRL